MGELSSARFEQFESICHKYFDWNTVIADAGIEDVQNLETQLLMKCFLHADSRPSLRVVLNQNYWHCFSCGKGGTVAKMMYLSSGTSISCSAFYEQLLKRTPAMQRELGFSSLFIDSKTLDPAFNGRRKFSAKNHIGASMPLSVFARRMQSMGDTWENLVYSLTMYQEGESPEAIVSHLAKITDVAAERPSAEISLMSLLDD